MTGVATRLARGTRAMLAASAILVAGVCEGVSSGPAALYEDATVRFGVGDMDGAIGKLEKALELEPNHLAARALLGRALLGNGEAPGAESQLDRARRSGADPELVLIPLATAFILQGKHEQLLREIPTEGHTTETDAGLLVLRGQAHLQLGELDRAAAAFGRAAELQPGASAPLIGSAHVLLRRGALDEAAALAGRASELAPTDAEPWYVKGGIEMQRSDLEAALSALTTALSHEPDHLPARTARAAVLLQLGRDGAALEDIVAVRRADPGDPQAGMLMALFLDRLGETGLAEAALRGTAALLPDWSRDAVRNDPPSLLLLALVSLLDGAREQARAQLLRCVQIAPHHGGAGKLLGAVMLAGGAALDATEVLSVAAVATPRDPAVHTLLGRAYVALRQYALAAGALQRSTELSPGDAGVWEELGRVRLSLELPDDAISAFEAALALDQGRTVAATTLARLYFERERLEDALRVSRVLLGARDRDPLALNLAGVAHMRAGDREAARALLERALAIEATFPPAVFNLGLMDLEAGDRDGARGRFQALVEAAPNDVRAMSQLARLALAEERPDDSVRWLEKARTAAPDDMRFGLALIDLYLGSGAIDRAKAIGRELEARWPDAPAVLLANARTAIAQNQRRVAITLLRQASTVAGYSAPLLVSVAELFERAGEPQEARFALQKALQGDTRFGPAMIASVYLEIRLGNFANALALARALALEMPGTSLVRRVEGDALMAAGRFDEAVERFRAAQADEDDDAMAIRVYRAERQIAPREALDALADWVRGRPRAVAARRVLAQALIEVGELEAAAGQYEAVLRQSPEDVTVLNNLAWLYHRTGKAGGLDLARRALDIAPRSPAVLDTLGWLLVEDGQPAQGLPYLREARTRLSRDPRVGYHLAVALERLGQRDKARVELKTVVASEQAFEQADAARALLRDLEGDSR